MPEQRDTYTLADASKAHNDRGWRWPARGPRCERCHHRIPRLLDLPRELRGEVEALAQAGKDGEAEALLTQLGLPRAWARLWVTHPRDGEPRCSVAPYTPAQAQLAFTEQVGPFAWMPEQGRLCPRCRWVVPEFNLPDQARQALEALVKEKRLRQAVDHLRQAGVPELWAKMWAHHREGLHPITTPPCPTCGAEIPDTPQLCCPECHWRPGPAGG